MRLRAWPIALVWFLIVPGASARTWHVGAYGAGEASTIQAGIDAAAAGDTVEVACGTYYEDNVTMKSGVTLRSATGNSDCVTLDAQGQGRVIVCVDQSVPMRIEGLTITGGQGLLGRLNGGGGLHCARSSLTISDCRFTGNASEFGGGLGCYSCSPLLERCDFDGNVAASAQWAAGGGIFCEDASPALLDCSFSLNTAFSTAVPGDGGGIFAQTTGLTATDCVFLGNSSGAGGGGFYSFSQDHSILTRCLFQGNVSQAGGAIYLEGSYAKTIDCDFVENSAGNGGAVYMATWSYPTVQGCSFTGNEAVPLSGGAIDCWHSVPLIEDCTFDGNVATLDGGAMASNGVCRPTFDGCRFVGNAAGRNGGVMSSYYATAVDFRDCTLVGNAAAGVGGVIYYTLSGPLVIERSILAFSLSGAAVACSGLQSVTLSCSNVHGNAGGDWVGCIGTQGSSAGNFSADPLFCNSANADYSLDADSPCLPPGNSCGVVVGAEGQGCGGGLSAGRSVDVLSWGAIKTKYR